MLSNSSVAGPCRHGRPVLECRQGVNLVPDPHPYRRAPCSIVRPTCTPLNRSTNEVSSFLAKERIHDSASHPAGGPCRGSPTLGMWRRVFVVGRRRYPGSRQGHRHARVGFRCLGQVKGTDMKSQKLNQLGLVPFAAATMLATGVWAAPPASSPYVTDGANEYVQDSTSDGISNLNMVLCIMHAMNPSDMLTSK